MRLPGLLAAMLLLSSLGVAAQNCMLRDANLRGRYDGDCLRGWANGQGRAEGKDRYEGAFMDGHAHGQGVYTFADGRRFEGLFVMGRVNGAARFHYGNGDVLEGEFRNDRLQGLGRLVQRGGTTLLVEMNGGTLVPVQPPLVATEGQPSAGSPAPLPTQPTSGTPPVGDALRGQWAPMVDLEDLFPSFILATATRKPPAAETRSVTPRGEELSRMFVPPAGATARVASVHQNARYHGDPWGLLGIKVRTERPGTVATVRVQVDEVADPSEESFKLESAGDHVLYPRLRYRWDRLRQVSQPAPVTVRWSLALDGVAAGTQTRVVRLRATQDVPWAVVGERGPEFLGWVFTAFVTEDAPWIDELLGEAFKGQKVSVIGYQGGEDEVIAQVAVVYEYLRRRGFKYSSITTGSGTGATQKVRSQVVRFPSESIRTSQANCVDGTVLIASMLRKMGLQAYIVTGPGHAMLGFTTKENLNKDNFLKHFLVVETTAMESGNFGAAVKSGMATFQKWLAKHQDDLMFDVISVAAARRSGVMPIAR